jgi:hypothetical protein
MIRVISLGAGVQSTTMALMAAHGEIGPMPDCAIFADTQGEPAVVYDHLRWLMSPNVLPFPVKIVTRGSLEQQVRDSIAGEAPNYVPWFSETKESQGMLWRSCTDKFKLTPLKKAMREMAGLAPGEQSKEPLVECWIGISTDEASRVKPSNNNWCVNRWPLIEKRMSRGDCLEWLKRNGYPQPPKSSCWFCPYSSDARWREIRDKHPAEWAKAVSLDDAIRGGVRASTGTLYAHRSFKPLSEVDLSTAEDRGQLNMFNNECDGMCGV